ncbi:MAG: alcohol dehydrogenase, partial [Rhizorhabdus sp.]|nr:alcohol dehydrogenase [Rhizorhabdus sp.]
LNMGARVVIYGSTGGQSFEISAPELFLKNVQIIGTNVGNPAEFRAMMAFVAEKGIEPVIETRFGIDDVKAAMEHLEKSHGFGKVVIDIGE